jgi:hypothetical protein
MDMVQPTSSVNATASAGAGQTLTSFTLFPELPSELRWIICEMAMAMHQPRLIHLVTDVRGAPERHIDARCPRDQGRTFKTDRKEYE